MSATTTGVTNKRWHFAGRQTIRGQECYTWKRHLAAGDPRQGYEGYAHPVATFWPITSPPYDPLTVMSVQAIRGNRRHWDHARTSE